MGGENDDGRRGERIDPLRVRRLDVSPDARGAIVVVRLRGEASPRVFAFPTLAAARAYALQIWTARQAALERGETDDE